MYLKKEEFFFFFVFYIKETETTEGACPPACVSSPTVSLRHNTPFLEKNASNLRSEKSCFSLFSFYSYFYEACFKEK